MHTTIQALVDRAADHFSTSLRTFKPWHGVNSITERNLSFQVATAFLEHFPDGFAFMEVPFTFKDRKRGIWCGFTGARPRKADSERRSR